MAALGLFMGVVFIFMASDILPIYDLALMMISGLCYYIIYVLQDVCDAALIEKRRLSL